MPMPYFRELLAVPAARPDGLDAPFWDGARAHRVRIQQCGRCSATQFPPAVVCRSCQAPEPGWVDVPGLGTLTSFTRVWHPVHPALADRGPYLVGVVELAPGARMVGNVLGDAERSDLELDMPMRAVFEDHEHENVTLIQWEPAS